MSSAGKNEIERRVSADIFVARATLHSGSVEGSQRVGKGLRVKENELDN
tara:strand:- start:1096 stop:1242 length:147 start_codon:yes stop_codon:yes gene_type:complete